MRTAILLGPPVTASAELPTCFADRIDEDAVREWLAHPAAPRRLMAVAPSERFDDAVARALGFDANVTEGVAVAYVAGHAVVEDGDWAALGLDDAFDRSKVAADGRVDEMISTASERFEAGAWDAARKSFSEADSRLANEASPRHTEVLVALGEIERLQGRTKEATALLDRALSISPRHEAALRARASIARSTGDHAIAAAMLHRLLDSIEDPTERGDILSTIAAESLEAARKAVLGALELRPDDMDLLHRRRTIAELAENWDDAVSVEVQLAEQLGEPRQRAMAFVRAANLCRNRAGNVQRAVALFEAAIEDDPRVPGAFEAVEAALEEAQDWNGLAKAYRRQLDRLGDEGDEDGRIELLKKLATVQREGLEDTGATIETLDEICALRPGDVEARMELAELLDWIREHALAIRTLEVAAANAPFRAEIYRELHRLFGNATDDDRAYSACAVLVSLGEADIDEQLVYSQYAPEEPLRIQRPFEDETWTLLAPDGHEEAIDEVMAALEPACMEAWVTVRQKSGDLERPDEKHRQDPDKTTVAAVRSFGWASKLLAVSRPAVYAEPDNAQVGAATVRGRELAVLLGRQVLTGRSPVELAFIATHHLAYARPGWRIIGFFPKVEELGAITRASVSIVRPDLVEPQSLGPDGIELVEQIRGHLDETAKKRLGDAIIDLQARGARLDVQRWVKSVELTACRAALLATGDVAVATPLLAVTASPVAGMTARDRARDLLPFSISPRYAALRRMLGVRVGRD